jgi:mannitol-specific phosphotransferase system IIBC component
MMQQYFDNTTKAGTAAGTLLSIFANINSEDLIKTALLAAVGAVVSFAVTLLLKHLAKRIKK